KRMFARPGREIKPLYSSLNTMRWLRWLATRLVQYGQTTFLIERLQPDWLQSPGRKPLLSSALMALWGPVYGLSFGAVAGLVVGLFGLFIVLLVWLYNVLLPIPASSVYAAYAGVYVDNGLSGPVSLLFIGLMVVVGLIGLVIGLVVGLIGGLIDGLIGTLLFE